MRPGVAWIVFVLFISILLRCGSNAEADGDAAYQKGNYNQALAFYLEVKKSQPDNATINEKIALSYMKRGKKLYDKTKNIDSFVGNFEKGIEFVPASASDSFNQEYSQLMYELARVYNNTPAVNEIQRENYFSKTLQYLEDALYYDPDNSRADSALQKIRSDNFQKMYDKGMSFYAQARREKNNGDLYISAERYLQRAVEFNPDHQEARKNLTAVRRKTISILKISSDVTMALAVADQVRRGEFLYLAVVAFNNTTSDLTFVPQNLVLVDSGENVYSIDAGETGRLPDGLVSEKTIKPKKEIKAVFAFKIPPKTALSRIEYSLDETEQVKKFFP